MIKGKEFCEGKEYWRRKKMRKGRIKRWVNETGNREGRGMRWGRGKGEENDAGKREEMREICAGEDGG